MASLVIVWIFMFLVPKVYFCDNISVTKSYLLQTGSDKQILLCYTCDMREIKNAFWTLKCRE